MDSDLDSDDDWVVLDSGTSSSSDDLVLALSSGCGTPYSATDSDADNTDSTTSILATAAAAAATATADDAEGVYAISDAEDEDAYPLPAPPLPKPLAGLFHHTLSHTVTYAAFDPATPTDAGHHHGAKQLVPDPTVIPCSGVGVLGCAFWRTTIGLFLCFEPVSGCADLVPAPMEVV
ncbi:unnamed protein product [Urochloa humidicola]